MFDTFLLKFTALVCLWGELLTWKLKGLIKYPCWCYWEIEMAIWGGEVTSKNQFGVDKSRLGLWFRHWSQHFFMDQSCQIVCDSETLLRTINGSSSFCKGPRTSKVWKSKDPKGPRTFKRWWWELVRVAKIMWGIIMKEASSSSLLSSLSWA